MSSWPSRSERPTETRPDIAATRLAGGSQRERKDLALLLSLEQCANMQPILAALVRDPDIQVRAQAAYAVGRLARATPNGQISDLATTLANSDGTLLVSNLLNGLSQREEPLSDTGTNIACRLTRHRSAWVRRLADLLLG